MKLLLIFISVTLVNLLMELTVIFVSLNNIFVIRKEIVEIYGLIIILTILCALIMSFVIWFLIVNFQNQMIWKLVFTKVNNVSKMKNVGTFGMIQLLLTILIVGIMRSVIYMKNVYMKVVFSVLKNTQIVKMMKNVGDTTMNNMMFMNFMETSQIHISYLRIYITV